MGGTDLSSQISEDKGRRVTISSPVGAKGQVGSKPGQGRETLSSKVWKAQEQSRS